MDISSYNGRVVSFVGAGGKTTLMYALARYLTGDGAKVIVTTTTHIYRPGEDLWAKDPMDVQHLWDHGSYAVVGRPCGEKKLKSLPQGELTSYIQTADVTLIEADGAKGMPCKVPAGHEPVIIDLCDMVIGVMGMDAVGKPLREVCFRSENAARLLGISVDDVLTADRAAKILASEAGTRKNTGQREYHVFLNKCEKESRIQAGEQVRQALKAYGISSALASAAMEERIWERSVR